MKKNDLPNQQDASDESHPHVFISYARPDQAVAEKVEAFLTAAGARVFFAPKSIGPGDNWIAAIDRALRECRQMVLLLSPHSMPERKEVEHEWNYFDLERKPIYPLYLQDCQRHNRLLALHFEDARSGLQGALERLLKKLRSDASLPMTASSSEPDALAIFRRERIAEWSLPRYDLDKRFVNLTLLLDKGGHEQMRWQPEDFRFKDLRDVLKSKDDPALVLLGAPGSGKSTMLRRLQLDHSQDRLCDGGDEISFFIQLNGYRERANGELPDPRQWLGSRWAALYPKLPPLESYLQRGGALLLLDAFNETPHRSADDYRRLGGLWREFAQEAARQHNRLIFSCRSLDYGGSYLSEPALPMPQIIIQPMDEAQVQDFLKACAPAHAESIWGELKGSPQLGLFKTPYFLKLLCEQVAATGKAPKGRAALFTGFVRQTLLREIHGGLFQPGALIREGDRDKISLGRWSNPFDLPERGALIPKLSDLAFDMQLNVKTEGAQVRIGYDNALGLVGDETILKAGEALSVLDRDVAQEEILFFHQLLQEYFAARRLAKNPDPALIHVEWAADKVSPTLKETIAGLADGDPLPPLRQTGWEETTLTAAPMTKDPQAFIRDLIPCNLPLAARCAASPELKVNDDLKREIQDELIKRTQDKRADLRARIAAGEALGVIGDPRFELRMGPHGDYLLPPLVGIPGGTYPMGADDNQYDDEKKAHTVELPPFQIGQFPVTNAEYKLFIDAGGYKDERWWDTEESLAWLRGEASPEGAKRQWRDNRKHFQSWSEDDIRNLVKQGRWTTELAENWITWRNWTDERFEQALDEAYPPGKLYRQPEYWDDTRFNNPSQPVVGVTWFEARAYCNWLTANAGGDKIYRLPTEAEFEAAARGKQGRLFPYGNELDVDRCNTFESHIRRTTPVGIFDNATPEGAFDLSGNAYTWTSSIYDQEQFPYPYRSDDGREDINKTGVYRALRGGAWFIDHLNARAVSRNGNDPFGRFNGFGFRLLVVLRPPSLLL